MKLATLTEKEIAKIRASYRAEGGKHSAVICALLDHIDRLETKLATHDLVPRANYKIDDGKILIDEVPF